MISFDKFKLTDIADNSKLQYCRFIGSLDVQYSHFTPFLWTFNFSCNSETVYGRTWADLRQWFGRLANHFNLEIRCACEDPDAPEQVEGHILKVFVEDLATFFQNAKKEIDFLAMPFIAKSGSDVLLASTIYGIQFQSYLSYYETEVNEDIKSYGIVLENYDKSGFSEFCKLSQSELEYCATRSQFICSRIAAEIKDSFNGSVRNFPLTKTAKISHMFRSELDAMTNKCACNLSAQITKMNPITSEWGRNVLLPLLHTAFYGGVAFFEPDTVNQAFDDAFNADFTSAYVARMVLSQYPMSQFRELEPEYIKDNPDLWQDLISPKFENYAMLITFEINGLELKTGGFPFIPATGKNRYRNLESKSEVDAELYEEILTSSTRIKKAKHYKSTFTDVDFKLLFENYYVDEIKITGVLKAKYGYLPDYIKNVIVKLYAAKARAKKELIELKKLGQVPYQAQYQYDLIKSELARLYGIFTQSPIVRRYSYNPDKHTSQVINDTYISKRQKFKPVVYQWGVWTTALVRKEIADLRRALLDAPEDRQVKVISGDTDCVNFVGNANDIIASYNDDVKMQLADMADAMGIESDALADLGCVSATIYKKYKITGLKQYCYIRETESGDVFGYKVGGMNPECTYFDDNFKTPQQKFDHFGVNLIIPASYKPRRYMMCYDDELLQAWTDRDGNEIQSVVKSYREWEYTRFVIHNIMSADRLSNAPRPKNAKMSKQDISILADTLMPISFAEFLKGGK